MIGLFIWKTGRQVKEGEYLIMHRDHRGEIKILHDYWIERIKGWQSKRIEIIAWCHLEDILTTSKPR